MAELRVGINRMNDLGRAIVREYARRRSMEGSGLAVKLVTVNEPAGLQWAERMLAFDGKSPACVVPVGGEADKGKLIIGEETIRFSAVLRPWELKVTEDALDIEIDADLVPYNKHEGAMWLGGCGARQVMVPKSLSEQDITVLKARDNSTQVLVYGVNQGEYTKKGNIVTGSEIAMSGVLALHAMSSNGVVPKAVTMDVVQAEKEAQPAIGGYGTIGQFHPMYGLPSSGVASIIHTFFPSIEQDRFYLKVVRVPVPLGSFTSMSIDCINRQNEKDIRDLFRTAAKAGPLKGIIGYTEDEMTSGMVIGQRYAALVDGRSIHVENGSRIHLSYWMDELSGVASGVMNLLEYIASTQQSKIA